MSKLIQITIHECYGDHRDFVSNHRGTVQEAMDKAVMKRYGKRASLCTDYGLNQGIPANVRYGQIGVPHDRNSTNLITGRVRVEAEVAA